MPAYKLMSTAAAVAVSVVLASTAFAQTTPVQPQPHDPNMPAQHNTVPEKIEPNSTGSTGTLSDKLDKNNGVIKPKADVDPGMTTTPAPQTGTMPVIPPPGSPGGNQSVQPK